MAVHTPPEALGDLGKTLLSRQAPDTMPNSHAKTPPRWQRYITGQKMEEAYRNNWNPNPMLIRIMEGSK